MEIEVFFFDAPKSRESSNTSMITPDEDEVAAGYVHSDQPKAQHNETVNQENNAIWVKRKKKYESGLWRMTLKNQVD